MNYPFYRLFADRLPATDAENTQFFLEFVVDYWNKTPPIDSGLASIRELIGSGSASYSESFGVNFRADEVEVQRDWVDGQPYGRPHIMSNRDLSKLLDIIEPEFDAINWKVLGWIHPNDYSTDNITPLATRLAELVGGKPVFPTRPGKTRPAWDSTRFYTPPLKTDWGFRIYPTFDSSERANSFLDVQLDTTLPGTCLLTVSSPNTPMPELTVIEETLTQANAKQGNITSPDFGSLRNNKFWGSSPTHELLGVTAIEPDLVNRYIVPQPCHKLWVSAQFSNVDRLIADSPSQAVRPGAHGYWIDPLEARHVLAKYVPQPNQLDNLLTLSSRAMPEGGSVFPIPRHPYLYRND